jgi:hypothetical protein
VVVAVHWALVGAVAAIPGTVVDAAVCWAVVGAAVALPWAVVSAAVPLPEGSAL